MKFVFAVLVALLAINCAVQAQEALNLNKVSLGWALPSTFSYYIVTPPQGFPTGLVASLNVSTSSEPNSGNVWVFLRKASLPTLQAYDYAIQTSDPVKLWNGNLDLSASYYIGVYGQGQAGTNWFEISLGGIGMLTAGSVVGGAWLDAKMFDLYTFNVAPNTAKLQLAVQAGYGDFEQFVGVGFVPTTSKFTYSNTTGYNQVCVSVNNPPAGTFYYMVYALYAGHYKTQYTVGSNNPTIRGCGLLSADEFTAGQKHLKQKLGMKFN